VIHLEPHPAPKALQSRAARAARKSAAAFFSRLLGARGYETPPFDEGIWSGPEVRQSLWELTAGKCAYCESPLGETGAWSVDHFRPTGQAVNLDGAVSPDRYWWLAYEWDNLLPACPQCSRNKGTRFPVERQRVKATTTGEGLDREGALLLDPRRDDPPAHLAYVDGGEVVGTTDRGATTIAVVGLNRSALVDARREELARLRAEWSTLTEKGTPVGEAIALTAASKPFAGMRLQFVATWLEELGDRGGAPVGDEVTTFSRARRKALKSTYDRQQKTQESFSAAAPDADYFISTRLVERVVITNIRLIEHLELMVEPATSAAPWLMLLGENSAGKSTVLQSVALALIGDAYRARLAVEPADYLRHGERRGRIEVYLSNSPEPIRLDVTKTDFRSNSPEPKVLLLGYGATRLLPRPRDAVKPLTTQVARVENLFDPFVPLGDPDRWLMELEPVPYRNASRALLKILDLDKEARLRRDRRAGRLEIETFGDRIPLSHLSAGYQSVVALAVDVMSVLFHSWSSMEVAEGIVVIDELGAHLHPRWRMQIVNALRDVFPRVQFLASTHDPLCLRGLFDGEVAVLRRLPDGGGVFALTDLPPIEGLRVDQILTSEVFGLNSTIDPVLDGRFARYYELRAKRTLTDGEKRELGDLHADLDRYELLGQTARERLMLEAADDYLVAERRETDPDKRRTLRASTKRQMARLWAETEPRKPPALR
jgi:uncharacterized protein (TIGR02646 family)